MSGQSAHWQEKRNIRIGISSMIHQTFRRSLKKTVPQVFPTTAPGNFTWREECQKYVMTSFYPYQWDLNYSNPVVFNEMVYNMLYLVNQGIDIVRIDAVPYIWKQLGTDCRNLPQVHTIVRMIRSDHGNRLSWRCAAG